MPVSLSDATTAVFVGCKASDPLVAVGESAGYAITVGLSALELFKSSISSAISNLGMANDDQAILDAATDLWTNLYEWSNNSLAVEYPQPEVVDSSCTVLASTLGPASNLTCGELVAALGKRSPLSIVQLKKVSSTAVRGANATATRGAAEASGSAAAAASATLNPLQAATDALNGAAKTAGIGIGIALAVGLAVFGIWEFHKRS